MRIKIYQRLDDKDYFFSGEQTGEDETFITIIDRKEGMIRIPKRTITKIIVETE